MLYSFIISKIKGCSFSKFRTGWGADFNTWENLRVGLIVLIWKENTIQCLNFPQNLASIFFSQTLSPAYLQPVTLRG